ncbi:MAG: sulfotransferase domain-containing protein [Chloroflexi bacterium]|nr:sulfotransferase domain-containing protein [Chloroflexota bacterium]
MTTHRFHATRHGRNTPSQRKMLAHRGEDSQKTDDEEMAVLFGKHLAVTDAWLKKQDNMQILHVHYHDILTDPLTQAQKVNVFLGASLDVTAMAKQVDAIYIATAQISPAPYVLSTVHCPLQTALPPHRRPIITRFAAADERARCPDHAQSPGRRQNAAVGLRGERGASLAEGGADVGRNGRFSPNSSPCNQLKRGRPTPFGDPCQIPTRFKPTCK